MTTMFDITTGERQIQLLRELYFTIKRDRDQAIQKIRTSPIEMVCGKFRCQLENGNIKYFISQYIEEFEEYNFEEFYGVKGLYSYPSNECFSNFSYCSVEIGKGGAGGGGASCVTYYHNLPPSCSVPSDSPALKNFSIKAIMEPALLETWREKEIGSIFYTVDTNKLYCVVNGPEKSDSDSTHIYSKEYKQLSRIHDKGLAILQDAVYSVPKKQKVLKEREVSREEFLQEPFELI